MKMFRKTGFSLVEIILSLLVVSIGIVAMLGLLGSTLDSSGRTRADLHAVSFADMVINYCSSSDDWDEISTSGFLTLPDYTGAMTALAIGSAAQFQCFQPGSGTNNTETFTVTYLLHVTETAPGQTKQLSLSVWPGFTTNGPPRVFFSEIYNWTDK